MNDVLATLIGVVLGVLASIPTALLIAAISRPSYSERELRDARRPQVTIEPPSTAVVVFHPDTLEVLP